MTTAVVLFNLGGPDNQEAVKPFLFNLFYDPAIIRLPNPFRWLIATLISSRRAPKAQGIYALMGGKSPIRELTDAQSKALEEALGGEYHVFSCMRYWHPRARQVMGDVKAIQPTRVILLPLYPQYSTTTTESSYQEWQLEAEKAGLNVPTELVCCYPTDKNFAKAHAAQIDETLQEIDTAYPLRLLFSAHGLPQKVVDAGDPYQWQVEQTVKAILEPLAALGHAPDWRISYQSRVGPMQWIGPSTEDEIARAGEDKVGLVVIPIAFVSEHSETLVELDIEYKHLADEKQVPAYYRVPALGTHPLFIESLAELVRSIDFKQAVTSHTKTRICPAKLTECACAKK